jgi:ribulose 1,5-bisphosphate synthetase/thiazole synthase
MPGCVREPAREIPVLIDTDIVVVGGGPAGIAASVSAPRTGAKTVVVERYGCRGGLISLGAMNLPVGTGWNRPPCPAASLGLFQNPV